jgi:phosphonate transport system substrate-binding protein
VLNFYNFNVLPVVIKPGRRKNGRGLTLNRDEPWRQRRICRRKVLYGLTALLSAPAVAKAGEESFSLGLTPVFLDNDMTLLSLLQAYLAQQLRRPVELVKRRTQEEIWVMLRSGQLDAAWMCDLPYVQHQERLALLAVPLYHGRPLYETYVIVNRASDAKTLDDLQGTVHAFSDPDSTSGYLITCWMLTLRQAVPGRFFRNFFFTYSHRNTIRAVANGLAESGSVDGYVWDVMKEKEPDLVERTRIVFRSEPLGFPPVVALNISRDRPDTQRLAAAFLAMTSNPLGREVLSMLALDGFTPASRDLYDSTAEKWNIVRAQT